MQSVASNSPMRPGRRFLGGRRLVILAVFGIVGVLAAWMISIQMRARSELEQAKVALNNGQPQLARQHLDQCLATWPTNAEAHFHAARAARQCGDLDLAKSHLEEASRFGWEQSAVQTERNLLAAQSGRVAEVEGELLSAVHRGAPESPQILALLVPKFIEQYRLLEARKLAEIWIDAEPNSATAWRYLGETLERLQKKGEATRAFREAIRLSPNDDRSRFALCRLLLDTRQAPDELRGHLDYLGERDRTDQNLHLLIALSRELEGRLDDAATELDRIIAIHPNFATALYHRGRIELNRGQATKAGPYLKRAAELDPSDIPTLYSHFQCLQQTGPPEEAKAAEERWKEASGDLLLVADLAKKIAESPSDPELRLGIGRLFLKHRRDKEGLRWLESALEVRPDHPETHLQLADYYERNGFKELATQHRSFVNPSETRPK